MISKSYIYVRVYKLYFFCRRAQKTNQITLYLNVADHSQMPYATETVQNKVILQADINCVQTFDDNEYRKSNYKMKKCRFINSHGMNQQFVLPPFNYKKNMNACFLLLLQFSLDCKSLQGQVIFVTLLVTPRYDLLNFTTGWQKKPNISQCTGMSGLINKLVHCPWLH